jgi:hypothetical protein
MAACLMLWIVMTLVCCGLAVRLRVTRWDVDAFWKLAGGTYEGESSSGTSVEELESLSSSSSSELSESS